MKTLTLEQLISYHIILIEETGGSHGVRDMWRLESALAAMRQTVFGKAAYPTIFEKSASLARAIIGDHPFVDGNKRTAMLAMLTQLELNGLVFAAKAGEVEDFAVRIAQEHLDIPEIARWLRTHTK